MITNQFQMVAEIQLLSAYPPADSDRRDHIDMFVVQTASYTTESTKLFKISHFIFSYGTGKQVDTFKTLEEALNALRTLAKQYNFKLPVDL